MAIGLAGVHVVKIVGEAKQEGSERSSMKVKEKRQSVLKENKAYKLKLCKITENCSVLLVIQYLQN